MDLSTQNFGPILELTVKRKLQKAVKEIVKTENGPEIIVTVRSEVKRPKLEPNVQVFQKFAMVAAMELKPMANKILMLFFAISEYENYINMDVVTICETISASKNSVLEGLKDLERMNIIVKVQHPSDRRRHDYFLNPLAAWKGNSFTRLKAISTLQKSIGASQLELFPHLNNSD